jgi:hypothetical protein
MPPLASIIITVNTLYGLLLPLCNCEASFFQRPNKSRCPTILYVQVTVHRDKLRTSNQQDASSIQNFILSRNSTCFKLTVLGSGHINLHETYQLPCVQLITPDEGHRRCPKHVQLRDKIKFWILDASCWLLIRRCTTIFGRVIKKLNLIRKCF